MDLKLVAVDSEASIRVDADKAGGGDFGCCPKNRGGWKTTPKIPWEFSQWLFLGPIKGWDRWHSPSPNWQEKCHLYTTYILSSGGLYATYHLLGEPETTIDFHRVF